MNMFSQDLLPDPDSIVSRIESCQQELAKLRRLLRATRAAAKADEERRKRLSMQADRPEVCA
jgi:hypothetical protein